MYDGTAQAWVGTATKSAIAGVARGYAKTGSPFPCAVQVTSRNLGDRGPGEAELGSWTVYAPVGPGATLLEAGMVVQVLTGPEAARTVRVQDPYRPRNRFQQARCQQWDGQLPKDDA